MNPGENNALAVDGLCKSFGPVQALNDVSFLASAREFLAVLGPSGSGKTTLLRVLAGLERPDAGQARFGDEDFLAIPARRRRAGMVFQHYALFRHMTVAQNIAFGLEVKARRDRPPAAEIRRRVADLLALVQLEGLGARHPSQLSGGQRQRVALARALAIEPRLLLLDEPFGALDAPVRRDLRGWLRAVHDRSGVTTVFVTHDQEEALDLADRVAILKDGRLVQLGAPQALYDNPKDAFVYDFLGPACHLPGVVEGGRLRVGDWAAPAPADAPDGAVEVWFRPDEVEIATTGGAGISASVRGLTGRGPELRIDCLVEGRALELRVRGRSTSAPGSALRFSPTRFKIYPRPLAPAASP